VSIKDKYNHKPATAPKSKGSRDIVEKILKNDNQSVNTVIQETVNTDKFESKQKDVKKATFDLDAKLHKRLRSAAVEHETTMVEIVEKALNEYLDKLNNQ
jgi:predicted HicB family RNase H-like nuclease